MYPLLINFYNALQTLNQTTMVPSSSINISPDDLINETEVMYGGKVYSVESFPSVVDRYFTSAYSINLPNGICKYNTFIHVTHICYFSY